MDKSTITLILGVTLGLAVVSVVFTVVLLASRASATVAFAAPQALSYQNEERWRVVKDENGRVRDIVVHRDATTR